jgi:threonine/homoserine/homoserine lactone efflux protein
MLVESLYYWLHFFAASVIFIAAPGPDTILLLGQGLSRGRLAGIGVAIGCALGCCLHTFLAVIGVTALVASSDVTFSIFKYLGAAYLFYLGAKSIFNVGGVLPSTCSENFQSVRLLDFVTCGFLSNALNPKVALFFLSFLPQFSDPAQGDIGGQVMALGLIFAMLLLCVFGVVGYFTGIIGGWLAVRPKVGQWLDRLAGFTCIALALRLILVERRF